jgi:hypothetical protein
VFDINFIYFFLQRGENKTMTEIDQLMCTNGQRVNRFSLHFFVLKWTGWSTRQATLYNIAMRISISSTFFFLPSQSSFQLMITLHSSRVEKIINYFSSELKMNCEHIQNFILLSQFSYMNYWLFFFFHLSSIIIVSKIAIDRVMIS